MDSREDEKGEAEPEIPGPTQQLLRELARDLIRAGGGRDAASGVSVSPELPLPKGASVGRYVVLSRVGSGGMGVVYAAYDPELDRQVALKLLRAGAHEPGEGEQRLLREAQAMARLSHPNVVAVYDVGTLDDRIFIAMEFVEGTTLARWLREQARPWREVLRVFLLAGRGLAAAHQAGIVHRDFKPENVLLDQRDGRVRVTDFGLARTTAPREATEGTLPESAGPGAPVLTQGSAVLGTPPYMAPEQHRGQPADARTDQFAFCVALYEGLYGERPFAGRTAGEIGENVLEGRIREPSTHRRVPGWVRRAVLKGLAVDPAERYPSTHALLSALERDSRRTWRRWLTALLVLGAAVAGGLGYQHFAEEPFRLCRGAERKLVGVWDEARKRALEAAFLRTGKPYAAQASSTVERLLDDYAQGWLAMHVQACEATRVHGEQSELLLDLRVQCLQDRLNEVRGLTDLFVQADARVVERATKAAHGLTRLQGCAGPELLTSGVRPPEDPSQRAQVEELRARLADAKALRETGHYREALRRAQRLAAYAREVPYRPVQAEALYLLGRLQDDAGDKAAEGTLLEAVRAAEAGRHDRVAALAWIELVFVAGRHMRFREAHERGAHAGAAIERLGGDEDLRAGLLLNLGAALRKEGRAEEALANHREALRVFEKLRGPNHPLVATTLGNLGVALVQMDRPTEAVPVLERSLAIRERVLGPEHPEVGLSLGGLGSAFFSLGRLAEAVSAHRRSLSIYEKALGPNHLKVATVLGNLGTALRQTGHLEEALALWRRALAIREGALGPKHPSVGEALASLGHVYASQGRHAEAWIHYRKAAPILEQPGSIHLPNRVFLLYAMGVLHRQEGRYPEALTLLRQALALWEKAGRPRRAANALVEIAEVRRERGQLSASLELYERARAIWEKYPWYPDRAKCLTRIGEARLLQGRPGQALPALEEALRLRAGRETQPAEMAETSFALSRALRAEGRDLVRALRLARQAETVLSQAGTKHRGELAAVRTWIRQVERDQPRQ